MRDMRPTKHSPAMGKLICVHHARWGEHIEHAEDQSQLLIIYAYMQCCIREHVIGRRTL